MTFKSAVDTWILIVGLVLPGVMVILAFAASAPMPASSWAIGAGATVVGLGLPVWLFVSTVYEVDNEQLLIRSGPFRWRIPLAEITSVKPSRSLLSSPALSLDRLEICYSRQRAVLVSPKDKAGFIRALGF